MTNPATPPAGETLAQRPDMRAAPEGATYIAVCSSGKRPSVQTGAKGSEWWRRDVYHLLGADGKTLCGLDTSDWLTIGPIQTLDGNCCKRCKGLASSDGTP